MAGCYFYQHPPSSRVTVAAGATALILAALIVLPAADVSEAAGPVQDGIEYSVDSSGKYALVKGWTSEIPRDVTIPASVKVGGREYEVRKIADWAFDGCADIASVAIPATVSSVGPNAFSGCASLTGISVDRGNGSYRSEDGVLYGGNTLWRCPEGRTGEFHVGAGVDNISDTAFNGCSGITGISVDEGSAAFRSVDGIVYLRDLTRLLRCPEGKAGNVSVAAETESMNNTAFRGCRSVVSVVIPGNAVVHGRSFEGCSSLSAVFISRGVSSGVTYVDKDAFAGCAGIRVLSNNSASALGFGPGFYVGNGTSSLAEADPARVHRISFVADGESVGEYLFCENEEFHPPAVPYREGWNGSWEEFALGGSDLTVSALYREVPGESDGAVSYAVVAAAALAAVVAAAALWLRRRRGGYGGARECEWD